MYGNKYISAKVNGTEFEHKILKDNKHCNIFVELFVYLVVVMNIYP